MRGPGHMASPLLLLLLLVRNAGAQRAAVCESDYVRVWSSQLVGGAATTIAGCYERNSYFVAHGKPVYTKTGGAVGGVTYGVLGSQVSDSAHGAPRWVIAQIHQHDPSMEAPFGVLAGTDDVEAEMAGLVCTPGEDWRTTGSPSGVQGWKCEIDGNGTQRSTEDYSVTVSCGCSALDREGSAAFDHVVGGGGGGGGGSARLNTRGVDRTANIRSRRRADVVAATDGSTSSSNSDNSSSGKDNPGFWSWIVISGCVIGLIVLCCVGWYIRNPWCKSAPLGDPNASVEDAVPQAPKTAFQPWGASQPPT